MNEFRKFLGLKQFETFEEWNPDKEIADTARRLYGHIDNLELYAGLQAEQTIPLGPGSGICCGYTMTRAILGDAIALVRGDRYYTTEYTRKSESVSPDHKSQSLTLNACLSPCVTASPHIPHDTQPPT